MNKPWLTRYPEGMPSTIDPSKHASLASMFESVCEAFSSKPAFSCMGKNISYSELEVLTRQLASYFQNELKLKKGDRIAIMSPNLLQYPVALFAALRSGLTVVNVNPLYTAPELKHQLNDSGAVAIVVVANFASVLEEVVDQTNIRHIIVTEIGDMLGSFRSSVTGIVFRISGDVNR